MNNSDKAIVALLVGAFVIGASPIFVRFSELGPIATGFHRTFLSLPLLYVWMYAEERTIDTLSALSFGEWRIIVAAGLFFVGDLIFWHWSIGLTTVAHATLFSNFTPVLVALGAYFLFGQRMSWGFAAGVLLTFAGAAILVNVSANFGAGHVRGDAYGLVTAVFYAGYMLSVAKLRQNIRPARIMFWSSVVSSVGLALASMAAGETLIPSSLAGIATLFGLAWLCQAMGQGLIAYAFGHLPAGLTAVIVLLQPLSAAFLGWLLLGETIGSQQMAGGAMILGGILVARLNTKLAEGRRS